MYRSVAIVLAAFAFSATGAAALVFLKTASSKRPVPAEIIAMTPQTPDHTKALARPIMGTQPIRARVVPSKPEVIQPIETALPLDKMATPPAEVVPSDDITARNTGLAAVLEPIFRPFRPIDSVDTSPTTSDPLSGTYAGQPLNAATELEPQRLWSIGVYR